jgi:hypothetical protein
VRASEAPQRTRPASEHESRWKGIDPPRLHGGPICVEQNGEANRSRCKEAPNANRRLGNVDGQDEQGAVCVTFRQDFELPELIPAWLAPRGEEMHERHVLRGIG